MDKAVYGLIDSVIYSFHMPLFFLLAGLLFPGSIARHSRLSLIKNKFRLIFYPYVVWSLIQGAIEVEPTGATNSGVTWAQVLSFMWQPRDQFWFLYILFVIFLVSALLYRRTNIYWSTIIVLIAAMLFVFKVPPLDFYVVNIFRACFVFFAVGVSARIFWLPTLSVRLGRYRCYGCRRYCLEAVNTCCMGLSAWPPTMANRWFD